MDREKIIQLGYFIAPSMTIGGYTGYNIFKRKERLMRAIYDSNDVIRDIEYFDDYKWKHIDPNIELTDTETIVALYLK